MTYARDFLRLVVIGRLYQSEDFSFSLSLIQGPNGPNPPPSSVPSFILTALSSYFGGTASLISNHAEITRVKLNEIGTDGRYTQPNTVEVDVGPLKGAAVASPAPQVALAVSLRTVLGRGRAHAGRYYLPMPGYVVETDGRLSTQHASDAAVASATFIAALNNGFADDWVVGVTSNVGTGAEEIVTRTAVGRVYDTIRSRRSSLLEDHQEAPVP